VTDAAAAFREQCRVVKPGGRVVCLDTTPPPRSAMRPILLFYLRRVIPVMGRLIAGDRQAYAYLTESTEGFKTPEELTTVMEDAGLANVRCRLFMFGTMAVHVGTRPAPS
jgi:demethylmenaquinone methyltransferase/2-methoxy-6-polyprenyl-1,4-benzoquinol methylase